MVDCKCTLAPWFTSTYVLDCKVVRTMKPFNRHPLSPILSDRRPALHFGPLDKTLFLQILLTVAGGIFAWAGSAGPFNPSQVTVKNRSHGQLSTISLKSGRTQCEKVDLEGFWDTVSKCRNCDHSAGGNLGTKP